MFGYGCILRTKQFRNLLLSEPHAIIHNQIAVMNRLWKLNTMNRFILGIMLREIQFRLLAVSHLPLPQL